MGFKKECILLPGGMVLALFLSQGIGCGPQSTGADGDGDPTQVVDATQVPGDDDDTSEGDDDTSEGGDDDAETTPLPFGTLSPSFRITGTFPQDGAQMVPWQLLSQVYFSEPYSCTLDGVEATLTGVRSSTEVRLTTPRLSDDGYSVGFPTDLWAEDSDYLLRVSINDPACGVDALWPLNIESTFHTGVNFCGEAFDVFAGIRFDALGADTSAAEELTRLLNVSGQSYPTAMVLIGILNGVTDTFPMDDFDAALASVEAQEDGTYAVYADSGVTTTLEGCSVSDSGQLFCESERMVVPFRVDGATTLYLYVTDGLLEAQLAESEDLTAMTGFELSGVMLHTDLYSLLAQANYVAFYDSVVFDVDTNGDGFSDAATVRISSDPQHITVTQCD